MAGKDVSKPEIRSEEELREMKRTDIRELAKLWELDPNVCMRTATSALVDMILEAQNKAGGSPKGAAKGKSAPPARAKEPTQRPSHKPAPPPPEEEEDVEQEAAGDGGELELRIDALGGAVDAGFSETKEILDAISTALTASQKQLFILRGLVDGLYIASEGGDGLDSRVQELEEEWEKSGN